MRNLILLLNIRHIKLNIEYNLALMEDLWGVNIFACKPIGKEVCGSPGANSGDKIRMNFK
jgi:hypothetical protein